MAVLHAPSARTVAASDRSLRDRAPWIVGGVTLTLVLTLLTASGFLFGTVEGDIPWPATPREDLVYYSARSLSWAAAAVALAGAVGVAFAVRRATLFERVGAATASVVLSIMVGAVFFLGAYGIGREHYLFAFTS